MEINFKNFSKFEIKVGTILSVENNLKAKKSAYVLEIDFGENDGIKKSSAQITNYSVDNLLGRKVVAVTNFPKKNIAGIISEVLVLGAITDYGVKLLNVDDSIKNGTLVG